MDVSAVRFAAIILGCLLESKGIISSMIGADFSISMYSSNASNELCLVAARVDGRPFSPRPVTVALRVLVDSQPALAIIYLSSSSTANMLEGHHISEMHTRS